MKRILQHFKIFLIIITIFLLSSCESVPPGTPPEGAIVNIPYSSSKIMNEKQAVNTMITALIASPEISSHKKTPRIKFEPPSSFRHGLKDEYLFDFVNTTLKVYKNLIASKLIQFSAQDANSDYFLVSKFKRAKYHYELERINVVFDWTLSLNSPKDPSKSYWSHTVTLYMPSKETKKYPNDIESEEY